MSVKERILAIRLMEKLQSHMQFAKRLGITACTGAKAPGTPKKEERS